jgi:integrase
MNTFVRDALHDLAKVAGQNLELRRCHRSQAASRYREDNHPNGANGATGHLSFKSVDGTLFHLVIFLAVTGLRIGEAIGLKWSDFAGDVLHVQRRVYEGKTDSTKTRSSDRKLPIPTALLERMKALGGTDWVFRSRRNTPLNPGNILKWYVQPVSRELGITLGGCMTFDTALPQNC